jgi:23S rRNA-/tRNA-specific pseudouridylate synthase
MSTISEITTPLELASRSCKILLQTSDYLIVDKPFDVRMDGNFEVTCEKIIQHKFPGLRFRHCHQLDFATSGALLYAASVEAAAASQLIFEERRVTKNYLAVVEGHILKIPDKEGVRKCSESDTLFELSEMRTREAIHGFGQKRPRVTIDEDSINKINDTVLSELKVDKPLLDTDDNINNTVSSEFKVKDSSSLIRFIVDFPIAPVALNDFRMRLGIKTRDNIYDGQSASTLIEVLQLGYFEGRQATKLLLTPITGRRHQLRLHTVLIGHPIIGDATYNERYISKAAIEDGVLSPLLNDESVAVLLAKEKSLKQDTEEDGVAKDGQESKTNYTRQRMLLHAWTLSLDFPWLGTRKFPSKRYKEAQKFIKARIDDLKFIEIESNDPFVDIFSIHK